MCGGWMYAIALVAEACDICRHIRIANSKIAHNVTSCECEMSSLPFNGRPFARLPQRTLH